MNQADDREVMSRFLHEMRMEANDKLHQSQLAVKDATIKELAEVLEFYARFASWSTHPKSEKSAHRNVIDKDDMEFFEGRNRDRLEYQYESGGKRARAALSKLKGGV